MERETGIVSDRRCKLRTGRRRSRPQWKVVVLVCILLGNIWLFFFLSLVKAALQLHNYLGYDRTCSDFAPVFYFPSVMPYYKIVRSENLRLCHVAWFFSCLVVALARRGGQIVETSSWWACPPHVCCNAFLEVRFTFSFWWIHYLFFFSPYSWHFIFNDRLPRVIKIVLSNVYVMTKLFFSASLLCRC